ncbi:MAG: DUF2520 domain-containing protein [Actinobacteria bacterium]|nr:DUF2520 domain-containing protein [Actinomycetota bacterium]
MGLSLGLALQHAGLEICGFFDTSSETSRTAASVLGLQASPTLRALLAMRPTVLFLAVPDSLVITVADQVASALGTLPNVNAQIAVAHTSGATPVSALDSCLHAGATTFGFHPLQTFAGYETGFTRFKDATIAVTPGPRGGWELGCELALALGAQPVRLAAEARTLYHAAACVASNYLVTLEYIAEKMFLRAGLPAKSALAAFLPLVRGAVDNLAAHGTIAALTGPLSRGDTRTIEQHLTALSEQMPEIDHLYRVLGLATLEIVQQMDRVPRHTLETLEAVLRNAGGPQDGYETTSPADSSPSSRLIKSSLHPPDTGEPHE